MHPIVISLGTYLTGLGTPVHCFYDRYSNYNFHIHLYIYIYIYIYIYTHTHIYMDICTESRYFGNCETCRTANVLFETDSHQSIDITIVLSREVSKCDKVLYACMQGFNQN